jgi:beta-1,2-mannobiose phosphorylase / 1,2-beta-oligomannan phosphorylase
VTGRELFHRHPANPILTAAEWPYPVNTVFNPAAARLDDGTTVLLARVEGLTGVSHLAVARSADGIGDWEVDPVPLLEAAEGVESEKWGFEDARVVFAPELGRWVITCTAYGPAGPAVFLATTEDFRAVERIGIVRQPDDKNAALLPDRIDGKWILFHRPKTEFGGSRAEILLSRSPDLVSWSAPEQVLQPREGAWWDSLRIGIGPPPLRTEHGWLLIYHGVKETVAGGIYRVGLALAALDEPARVLHRLPEWVLGPLDGCERSGDVPNVVFPCGLVHDRGSGEVRLYYGAADTSICVATAQLDELVDAVRAAPA